MRRAYGYVGPADLAQPGNEPPYRVRTRTSEDIRSWVVATNQKLDHGEVTATFIIDLEGDLWIADRHSEHVQCARGQPVLSAGEMTFRVGRSEVEVSAVSNQSTGYCPEPESWPAVASALERAGLVYPDGFTTEFVFRRCEGCGTTNIIKDCSFECGVCEGPLSACWNF